MLSGNLHDHLLEESESKENGDGKTSILVLSLSDEEKYLYLSFIKDFILNPENFDPNHGYGESEHPGVNPICGYSSNQFRLASCLGFMSCCLVTGGAMLVTTTTLLPAAIDWMTSPSFDFKPSENFWLWPSILGGMGALSCMLSIAVASKSFRDKYRKANRLVLIPDDERAILNSVLKKLERESIQGHTDIKTLDALYKTTDKALSDTVDNFIQIGKTVKSTLSTAEFFSQGSKLVLSYLMPNEKILDRVLQNQESGATKRR